MQAVNPLGVEDQVGERKGEQGLDLGTGPVVAHRAREEMRRYRGVGRRRREVIHGAVLRRMG